MPIIMACMVNIVIYYVYYYAYDDENMLLIFRIIMPRTYAYYDNMHIIMLIMIICVCRC